MGLTTRLLVAASAALSLALFGWLAQRFYPFTVDDTFISLRYAKHLAWGLGPTWNPGGPRVEGYTSALWVLLLTLPHALGLDALAFAKLSGVAFIFGSITVAALIAHELTRELDARARGIGMLLPFALLAAYWPLSLHAISGMETALAALLLTTFIFVSARHLRMASIRRARTLGLLSLACTLTRPEAGLACCAALLMQVALSEKPARGPLVRALASCFVLPGALYFSARYAYFGLLFPLPFYVKATGQVRFAGLEEVTAFLRPFYWPRTYFALLALCGAVRSRRLYPALLGMVAFALFFLFPAHIMGFEGRYLAPLAPAFAALIAIGLAKLVAPLFVRAARHGEKRARVLELALALALWASIAPFRFPVHESDARARWLAYGDGLQRAHVALARSLAKLRPHFIRPKIALLDVGAVAYYSDWFTIDTYGLNDARVALSRRSDVDYVFAQQPEVVVVVSAEGESYVSVFEWEQPIYDRARSLGYGHAKTYEFLPDYHLLVLTRSEAAGRLSAFADQ